MQVRGEESVGTWDILGRPWGNQPTFWMDLWESVDMILELLDMLVRSNKKIL